MRIGFFVVTQPDNPKSVVHLRLAELMMKSARAVMPDVEIVQLTDGQTARVIGVNDCIRIDGEMPMAVRRMTHHSQLEGEWLFVDPDVMFRRDVRDVFDDKGFAVAVCDRHGVGVNVSDDYADAMPHNTGVVFSRSQDFWHEVLDELTQLPKKAQEWTGDQLVICNLVKTMPRVKYLPGRVYNFAPDDEATDVSEAAIVHYKGSRKDMMFMDKHLIIGGVGVPMVKMYAAMPNGERSANMDIAIQQGFPVIEPATEPQDGTLSIVCYGPSLKSTWQQVRHPIMTVSGAHDFMLERGVIPEYHTDCDPRPYKAEFVKRPDRMVHYLMGSCMDAKTWEYLKGMKVTLWHAFGGDETDAWMRKNGRGQITIGGGTTAGLRAIMLGGLLGYRKFDIYGMDCSFDEKGAWAGKHYSNSHKESIRVRCDKRWFRTSYAMIGAAREMEKIVRNNQNIEVRLHGDGMLQEMLKTGGYEALCA